MYVHAVNKLIKKDKKVIDIEEVGSFKYINNVKMMDNGVQSHNF